MARHEVQRQLDLVGSIGAKVADTRLCVRVTHGASDLVREMLADCGVQPGAHVVVHPGGTAPSRRYPPEMFAEVVAGLERQGLSVVVTGDATEWEIVEQTLSRSKGAAVDLTGRLSLEQLCAVIADARVLIAGNTGPVHLAAAVGTPVVDLYALTNPQHTPWAVPSRVLSHPVACQWCYKSVCPEGHHLCLRGVAPASVVAAALELLEERIERAVPGCGAVDARA
jgi:ADP-heptose:LPS heptosyltransferase